MSQGRVRRAPAARGMASAASTFGRRTCGETVARRPQERSTDDGEEGRRARRSARGRRVRKFGRAVVVDLQGNRAGAREARLADRVAAATLATAAPPFSPMVSSGGRARLRPRRAEHLGEEPQQRRGVRALAVIGPPARGDREIAGKRSRSRSDRSPFSAATGSCGPRCRGPRITNFPGNPPRPSLRTLRAQSPHLLVTIRSRGCVRCVYFQK